MSITLKLFFDSRRPLKKKGGEYPFKLRVTWKRKSLEFQTIYSLSKADEKKLKAPHVNESLQEMREKTRKCLADAQAYLATADEFLWPLFMRDFININPGFLKRKLTQPVPPSAPSDFDFSPYQKRFKSIFQEQHPGKDYLSYVFLIYIKKLLGRNKIGSALNYQYAYNSLKEFGGNVQLNKITEDWLFSYEHWMTTKERNSLTTVSIVLRSLRCIFNEAASSSLNIINKNRCYPFGKRKYQIPASRNTKLAFDASELRRLYEYKPVDPEIAKGMDYWWFLYFGNGMNLKDAALLRFKNIQEDFIIFRRAKTDRTSRATMLPISVYINEDMRAIIERRGNKSENPENFIFPILNSEMNPLQQHDEIKAFIRLINRSAQIACKEIGLSKKCTTKVSRHSFMTQQKRNGASIEEIQEAVGHTSPSTTQFYLDSFELEMKRSLANNTCKFKEA